MKGLRIGERKASLRNLVRKKRDALSSKQRKELAGRIEKKVFSHPLFKAAKTVMFYVTHRSEVDTSKMIKSSLKNGKIVVVPKVNLHKKGEMSAVQIRHLTKDLEHGFYGIFEPRMDRCRVVDEKEIELIFVPGMVFDERGNRIGYGKGFYDRWLKKFKRKVRIGLAYDFQVIREVPTTKKDVRMGSIVTDKRMVRCSKKSK